MGFNPADYAAVENTAKSMSKTELESYYVSDRNKRLLCPGDVIAAIVAIIFIVLMIGLISSCFVRDKINNDIQEVSVQVSNEVCPVSDKIYFDIDLKSTMYNLKVDCSTYRHK